MKNIIQAAKEAITRLSETISGDDSPACVTELKMEVFDCYATYQRGERGGYDTLTIRIPENYIR